MHSNPADVILVNVFSGKPILPLCGCGAAIFDQCDFAGAHFERKLTWKSRSDHIAPFPLIQKIQKGMNQSTIFKRRCVGLIIQMGY